METRVFSFSKKLIFSELPRFQCTFGVVWAILGYLGRFIHIFEIIFRCPTFVPQSGTFLRN